jgi:hypothetical protein
MRIQWTKIDRFCTPPSWGHIPNVVYFFVVGLRGRRFCEVSSSDLEEEASKRIVEKLRSGGFDLFVWTGSLSAPKMTKSPKKEDKFHGKSVHT